jgi:hypothetical protein
MNKSGLKGNMNNSIVGWDMFLARVFVRVSLSNSKSFMKVEQE